MEISSFNFDVAVKYGIKIITRFYPSVFTVLNDNYMIIDLYIMVTAI